MEKWELKYRPRTFDEIGLSKVQTGNGKCIGEWKIGFSDRGVSKGIVKCLKLTIFI